MTFWEKFLCAHQWKVVAKVIAKPRYQDTEIEGIGAINLMREVLFGKTKLISTCEKCGKYNEAEFFGQPE